MTLNTPTKQKDNDGKNSLYNVDIAGEQCDLFAGLQGGPGWSFNEKEANMDEAW